MPETRTISSTGGMKGTKLARHDLIPPGPLTELAEHYGRGARKYANHQWRKGYEWSKSYAAMIRHATLWNMGYDYDVCSNDPDGCSLVYPDGFTGPDGEDLSGQEYVSDEPDTCFNHTGSHHMAAVAWHAFLLLEFKDAHPEHDDRYKPPSRLLGPEWENVGWIDGDRFDYSIVDESQLWDEGVILPQKMALQDGINRLFDHYYPDGLPQQQYVLSDPVSEIKFSERVEARFTAGPHGTEDRNADQMITSYGDAGAWLEDYYDIERGRDTDLGYVSEYRALLRKHAPSIDTVGDVL